MHIDSQNTSLAFSSHRNGAVFTLKVQYWIFLLICLWKQNHQTPGADSSHLCALRDGGLKRAKVKDAFKEEQQKLYSKVLVGEQDNVSNKHSEDATPEED